MVYIPCLLAPIHSFIHPSIHTFIHPSIHPSIRSFIHFILSIHSSVHVFFPPFFSRVTSDDLISEKFIFISRHEKASGRLVWSASGRVLPAHVSHWRQITRRPFSCLPPSLRRLFFIYFLRFCWDGTSHTRHLAFTEYNTCFFCDGRYFCLLLFLSQCFSFVLCRVVHSDSVGLAAYSVHFSPGAWGLLWVTYGCNAMVDWVTGWVASMMVAMQELFGSALCVCIGAVIEFYEYMGRVQNDGELDSLPAL